MTTIGTRRRFGGVLLLVAGVALGWSVTALWHGGDESSPADAPAEDEDAAPELEPGDLLVTVTTGDAAFGELAIVVAAAGVVRAAPSAEQTLGTRAGGRVLATHAEQGQFVHAGDVLLSLDPVPLRGAVAQARASLAQATDALAEFETWGRSRQQLEAEAAVRRAVSQQELLEAQAARILALHDEGLSSDKALAEAKQAAAQARSDRELAERAASDFRDFSGELQHATLLAARDGEQAAVDETERQLAEADVRTPVDGQLLTFLARAGQRLEAGQPFAELLAAKGRLVAFAVTPAAARELQPGARATWVDAQGAAASGTLQSVGGDIDPSTGQLVALVAPDAGSSSDPPGMAVRGELELRRLNESILVPERAVLRAGDVQVVVLADGDRARRVPVTVTGRHAGLAAVVGDVHVGDRVIVEGGYNLPDGAHIVAHPVSGP